MKATKESLRQYFLEIRDQLKPQYIQKASDEVANHLLHHPRFKESETILIYMAFRNEVDLSQIVHEAWKQGKQILVPKTNKKDKKMEPYLLTSWDELVIGNYGIFEPNVSDKYPFPFANIELVLVPGLAYDRKGYRLGYGGGYYDRFFDQFAHLPYRIGVGFDFGQVEELPHEPHDYPVNEICTEMGCTKLYLE